MCFCTALQRSSRATLVYLQVQPVCQRSPELKPFSRTRGVYLAFVPACLRSLTQLRMERENAEARVRDMEDQLAEFQDELRRETGTKTVLGEHSRQHLTVRIISFFRKVLKVNTNWLSVSIFWGVVKSATVDKHERSEILTLARHFLSSPCAPCAAGPDVLSDSADGGLPAEAEAGGDTEAERARADGTQRGPEGRGGQPRQGDRDPARAVQQRHGEAPRQHGAGVSGVCTQTCVS